MIHFGTGGWRAVIGDGFTKANVQLLTLALARKMLDEGRADKGFVIGYDRRFLSEEAAGWAAEVMAGQGILCRIIHRESPTPLIMYTVAAYGLPYGMAITASHNPAVYNGIKVFMEGGRDADETLTAAFDISQPTSNPISASWKASLWRRCPTKKGLLQAVSNSSTR